jgi:hypothetical protein
VKTAFGLAKYRIQAEGAEDVHDRLEFTDVE